MIKKMILAALVAVGSVAAGSAGFAADKAAAAVPAGPELDYTKAAEGTYTVDGNHAFVHWKVWHMGFSHYTGRFGKISGSLRLKPTDLAKSNVSISIDPASVDSGNAKLHDEMVSDMFFDAAKYPQITFKSTKVDVLGKDAEGKSVGKVYGDLTFHGVTKPVVLDATFNGFGPHLMTKVPTLGFSARGTINRSDFGVKTYIPVVSDEVELEIEVEFSKAG